MRHDPPPDFDTIIDRRGTNSDKWDMMEAKFGVPAADGLAMWTADMDFRSPPAVTRALRRIADHGIYGYFGDDTAFREAIAWWQATQHGWEVERDAIFASHGTVNAVALCLDAFTAPGDAVVLMTPVYHAFHRIVAAAGREIVQCPLPERDGRYVLDPSGWEERLTGRERMVILCSPHNPGGRVWTRDELEAAAEFARRHDLILLSDEIHQDLRYPGRPHFPTALIDGVSDRLAVVSAASKTFNIAGVHCGYSIIPDPDLRARFGTAAKAGAISPDTFGLEMTSAAYSPEGAAWLADLMAYLDGNRKLFDEGIARIPGARPMPLDATYLAWIDFSGTGLDDAALNDRVTRGARIAPSPGPAFGAGGEQHLRFNFGMPRVRVQEAVERLQRAFADLQ